MTRGLPTLAEAKAQAKRLRADRAAAGLTHAASLEAVARRYGFRDWNTLHAAIRDLPPQAWRAGGRVTGRYLGQSFVATVLSAEQVRRGWWRLALDLDQAVDVVRFDSFSAWRKRVRAVVGPAGHTVEKTSDGAPHVVLDL